MGLRFRQSFTIIPGIRLNVSTQGLSASIGGTPFTVNIGPQGLTETLSLPGIGLSYRHHQSFSPESPVGEPQEPSIPHTFAVATTFPIVPVHSASAEVMTSLSLQELKKLIGAANDQYRSVSNDLDDAYNEKAKAVSRYESWNHGWLFKRVFKTKFAQRRIASEEATAKATELEIHKDASRITLDIHMEDGPRNAYHLMVEAFSHLLECRLIWDINSHRRVDQWHERSSATDAIERTSVSCGKDRCDLLKSDLRVPHLPNSKGGGLYFYPGFILYTASRDAFSLIEYHEVNCKAIQFAFTEHDPISSDTQVIGSTWLYANKDGSRDRRFASNSEIPVVKYGGLNFATTAGLREEFMLSRSESVNEFVSRMNEFAATFSPR